eukprot:SAG22_NODE_8769_length_631_cov_1.046992_2_plen_28_part_01
MLTVLCGGGKEHFALAQPVLDLYASNVL